MHHLNRLTRIGTLCLLSSLIWIGTSVAQQSQNTVSQAAPEATGSVRADDFIEQRDERSLDGDWSFMPAEGEALLKPAGEWSTRQVPDSWGERGVRGWYERRLLIPESWRGRTILLELQRVSTDAMVYINGDRLGEINWPGGTIDITSNVTPGRQATILLRVVATEDVQQLPHLLAFQPVDIDPGRLEGRGLIGSVVVRSRPKGAHVSDVFIQTSTGRGELSLDIELAEVIEPGTVRIDAEVFDASGRSVRRFDASRTAEAKRRQVVQARWPWADAELWDIGQPNLYTLRLRVTGAGLDDTWQQRFGFREFRIEGRQFYLNGTPIRLRPTVWDDPAESLVAGFNLLEHWPNDLGRRGTLDPSRRMYRQADEVGILVAGNALSFLPYMDPEDPTRWMDQRRAYNRRMRQALRPLRNHPSVVMWATSANAFGHPLDQHPRFIGRRNYSHDQEFLRRIEQAGDAISMIRQFDPTRPVFAHQGTWAGDVHACNMYLNFIPLQEREQWLSSYVEHGEMPFMAAEFGVPLYASLMRGRGGYAHQGHSEPFLSEWCARYLGAEAYRLEPAHYRQLIAERYDGSDPQRPYQPGWFQFDDGDQAIIHSPAFQKVLDLFIGNTWQSWRTAGIAGGMVPWEDGHDSPALAGVNRSTLAWIAGPPGDHTAKGHNFDAAESVTKQIVLINDDRQVLDYQASWQVTLGDRVLAEEEISGQLQIAEILKIPLTFTTPDEVQGDKVDGRITLTGRIGEQEHEDTFDFRVFTPLGAVSRTIHLFDPVGRTKKMLEQLGYRVKTWDGTVPMIRHEVIVIGRQALSDGHLPPGSVKEALRAGARVLVFAQDPDWLRYAWHLRVGPHIARRVYPVDAGHTVTEGLDAQDLADWRGRSTLVEARPEHPGFEGFPRYGWRWGNAGGVCSAPIEKPHRTGWRPILETEFDLAYTPLMEMDWANGRITLTTLDLEDHFADDPAAWRVAIQLIEHVATADLAPRADGVLYVGDDAGAALLDELDIVYERGRSLDHRAELIIVGSQANLGDAELSAYARQGGRLLMLMRHGQAAELGLTLRHDARFAGSIDVPDWPQTRGISASDLRWRSDHPMWLYQGANDVQIGGDGLLARRELWPGLAVFVQIDPFYLPVDKKPYFRFTSWRQMRSLAQLLANLGAHFRHDDRMIALIDRPDHPVMLAGPWQVRMTIRHEQVDRQWHKDPGMSDQARRLVADDAPQDGWQTVHVPAYMESYGPQWEYVDGECVFRKVVEIPAYLAGRQMFLSLGRVDESEATYFNGELIGSSRHWFYPRGHVVPGRLVRPGRNVIAVRTWDEGLHGGICGAPGYLVLHTDDRRPGFYHDDYIEDGADRHTGRPHDWEAGERRRNAADNPYRYRRW